MAFAEDLKAVLGLILGGDIEIYAERAGRRVEGWKSSFRGLIVWSP